MYNKILIVIIYVDTRHQKRDLKNGSDGVHVQEEVVMAWFFMKTVIRYPLMTAVIVLLDKGRNGLTLDDGACHNEDHSACITNVERLPW